jgi:tetratricopeptide (TPR) repeat protein
MLGVVREYALERLEASGELEAVRKKHAAHFLGLAEVAGPELQSARPGVWLNRLEEEYDNIREALRWSIESDPETAARMGAAIRYFWDYMGYLTEGLGILKQIVSKSDHVPARLRCKLFSQAGNFAKFLGDRETARQMYERGLNEATSQGDLSQVSLLCRGLGSLAVELGDHHTACRFIDSALAAAHESNDRFGIARSLNMRGDLARSEGDFKTARKWLKEALEVCRQVGGKYAIANIVINLAAAEFGDGDYERARAHFTEALTMAQELDGKIAGERTAISHCLDGFAALAVRSGKAQMAATLAGAAERLRQAINFKTEVPESRFREAYLVLIHATLPDDLFAEAYEQGRKMELDECVALALGATRKLPPSPSAHKR